MHNDDLVRVDVEKRPHLAQISRETSAVETVLAVEGAAVCADLHVEVPNDAARFYAMCGL